MNVDNNAVIVWGVGIRGINVKGKKYNKNKITYIYIYMLKNKSTLSYYFLWHCNTLNSVYESQATTKPKQESYHTDFSKLCH